VIQPNAGMPKARAGRTVYDESPGQFAAGARELAAIGVSVIGGCCGTTPEHIEAVVASLNGPPTPRA
jgi:5-methyltetrahydrofolate--homocysteine methyltransferase